MPEGNEGGLKMTKSCGKRLVIKFTDYPPKGDKFRLRIEGKVRMDVR